VPFAWIDVKGERKNVAVLQQQNLLEYIKRRSKRFEQAQIDWYVAALDRIARAQPVPCRRPAASASARAA
jgi:hypothetical protein